MKKFQAFDISFIGLKLGKHQFDYQIDAAFLEDFGYHDVTAIDAKVRLDFDKKNTMLELYFSIESAKVDVLCDVSNEPFSLEIEGSLDLVVQFGEEYNDENEEILILPHGEHLLNVAQYIYEMIVLSIPVKRVHPGIEDGTLSNDIVDKLEELRPENNIQDKQDTDEDTDPRWDTLKKLLTDK